MKRHHASRGLALVLVLAMLVLVAGMVTAFFSRALQERRTGASSTSAAEAGLFGDAAVQIILADFLDEIESGSEPDPLFESGAADRRIFRPILIEPQHGEGVPLAPSMSPQQTVGVSALNVLKVSREEEPFFRAGEGYLDGREGSARASGVSTSDRALNGRRIPPGVWNQARLLTAEEFAAFQAPDWIYVDRAGHSPTVFDGQTLPALRSSDADNPEFVIGRFAYVVHDMGGLLDMNVAGNALEVSETDAEAWDRWVGRRGRLHQIRLQAGLGSTDWPEIDAFLVDWRSPPGETEGQKLERLFDPQNAFLDVPPGGQALVTRQDLIDYARRGPGGFDESALPYLTVHSRALNAPHWRPDPERPRNPTDADLLNPILLEARFATETTLERGADPAITVPAGTPVMPRRFPLGKLALFEEANPDPDSLRYYFGLRQVPGQIATYEYIADIEGRIARLPEVANLGREPNFFEILQAVILTDSLGKHAGDSVTQDEARDSLRNLQALRIGANIIDQWDADDIPTIIRYPSGDADDPWLGIAGTENLPYLNQMVAAPWRPAYDQDRFQIRLMFDVWNPHQNALTPPSSIEAFRILPTGGQANAIVNYLVRTFTSGQTYTPLYNRTGYSPYNQQVLDLNAGQDLSFPARPSSETDGHTHYAEPRTLFGDEPGGTGDQAGFLVIDYDMNLRLDDPSQPIPNPAVPRFAERSVALQEEISVMFDILRPYRTIPEDAEYELAPGGEREYPPGTQFEIDEFNGFWEENESLGTFWVRSQAVGNFTDEEGHTEEAAFERIRARMGTKAHNFTRFRPRGMSFALQARVNGQWRTYQEVENFEANTTTQRDAGEGASFHDARELARTHTHHSETDPDLEGGFYIWRKLTSTRELWRGSPNNSFHKFDPRTNRFGFSTSSGRDNLGLSPRSLPGPWGTGSSYINASGAWVAVGRGTLTDHGFDSSPAHGWHAIAGLVSNHPNRLDLYHPLRYASRDGVIRPGDGFFGWAPVEETRDLAETGADFMNLPTIPGRYRDRPVILNRPFRSVGELGYAFRDEPWKTLDFSSRHSADLGLLNVFSLEESVEATPVVAGKINLNSARPEVLQLLLQGTTQQLAGVNPELSTLRFAS